MTYRMPNQDLVLINEELLTKMRADPTVRDAHLMLGDGFQAPGAVVLREAASGELIVHFANLQTGGYHCGLYFAADEAAEAGKAYRHRIKRYDPSGRLHAATEAYAEQLAAEAESCQPADKTYNGYANRETYDVHLWCSSATEAFYDMCRAVAQQGSSDLHGGELLRVALPDLVQAEWSSSTLYPGGFVGELIGCALARVNWREVAASLREV